MTKQEYINYWTETSHQDWGSSEDLYKTNHFLQALFFAHLSLEKICKALWVKDNDSNHPPRIHNLVFLIKQTKLEVPDERINFLLLFNDFQLEGRYPDYQQKIYRSCNKENTAALLSQANECRLWLLSKLP